MSKGKYIKDYRLLETIEASGRIRTDYEYIGPDYRFCLPKEEIEKTSRVLMVLGFVSAVLFIIALFPNSKSMRTWFVAVPFAFAALPLGMLIDALISLSVSGKNLERRQADKFSEGIPARFLAAGILTGISSIGALVSVISGKTFGSDWLFIICAICISAGCIYGFSLRRKLAVRKA